MEEFAHYAHNANGSVHLVAPGCLILFKDPANHLPAGQDFESFPRPTGGFVRRFSPDFYADLLSDLGAHAVASLGSPHPSASAEAFAARGLVCADLCDGSQRLSPLRALDGLLSLARSGAVAVHSGGGDAWPDATAAVLATVLVSVLGFEEREAWGWLALVCPWILRPSLDPAPPGPQ